MKKTKNTAQRKSSKKANKEPNGTTRKIAVKDNMLHDDHGSMIIGKREEPPGF